MKASAGVLWLCSYLTILKGYRSEVLWFVWWLPRLWQPGIHACVQSSGRVPVEMLRWSMSARCGARRCERYFQADVGARCLGALFVGLSRLRVCWTSLASIWIVSWWWGTVTAGSFERKKILAEFSKFLQFLCRGQDGVVFATELDFATFLFWRQPSNHLIKSRCLPALAAHSAISICSRQSCRRRCLPAL